MDINRLKAFTSAFLLLYWPKGIVIPEWSEPWDFDSEIPNHREKGCYAHLDESGEVIYVGVAIANGDPKTGQGLGLRLHAYWQLNKDKDSDKSNKYAPVARWEDIKGIVTIPFLPEHSHLAAALEVYLIERIRPIRNSKHK